MDVKLAFLTVAITVLSYQTEINREATDSFTAVACQKFPVRQQELYHFVTFPDIADKWLDWMSYFAAADHKALGVGKTYKAIIKNFVMYFKVTEFTAGAALVMESNFLFRPRVELQFSETATATAAAVALMANESTPQVLAQRRRRQRHIGRHNCSATAGNHYNGMAAVDKVFSCSQRSGSGGRSGTSSKLIIKLYFQRNSLMFQYTLGTILRSIFEYQLRESLQNLLAIVIESSTCPNIFVLH